MHFQNELKAEKPCGADQGIGTNWLSTIVR